MAGISRRGNLAGSVGPARLRGVGVPHVRAVFKTANARRGEAVALSVTWNRVARAGSASFAASTAQGTHHP